MKRCFFCGRWLQKDFQPLRIWCSEKHRNADRRRLAREVFDLWRARPLPTEAQDLRSLLTESAARGAFQFRLCCPNLGNGGKRYFPQGTAWRLKPFQSPSVPIPGFYRVIWYGAIGELLQEGEEIAITGKLIGKCKSDTKRDFAG